MGCKEEIRVRLITGTDSYVLKAFHHPRGCMRARQDHLDLENIVSKTWLWEIARPRGHSLYCNVVGNCIVLEERVLGLRAMICPLGGIALRCRREVYVMVSRSGWLYIGPVTVVKGVEN